MPPIKLIIIGAGNRGANYAECAISYPDQAKVVGVDDPREHYRAQIAAQHGILANNVYADWREVVARPRFADAVIVATPDALFKDDSSLILSGSEESLESHLMVFAAERARMDGRVVDIEVEQ